MGSYDTQVVCLNGHQITDRLSSTQRLTKHCQSCGAEGVSQCPQCKTPILGYFHADGVMDLSGRTAQVPRNCANCGAAFPWKDAIDARKDKRHKPLEDLAHLLSRFHGVARQLRSRHDGRETLSISDEYDAQDLLFALLRLSFDDIRPEEWTPSYAGKSNRMDFLLKPEQIVLEVKMARRGLSEKEVGDQLIVDIARYREHPDCKTLLCFVYDPEGWVRNAKGLCSDLERSTTDIAVKVMVAPVIA
jgi:hypothetical protein